MKKLTLLAMAVCVMSLSNLSAQSYGGSYQGGSSNPSYPSSNKSMQDNGRMQNRTNSTNANPTNTNPTNMPNTRSSNGAAPQLADNGTASPGSVDKDTHNTDKDRFYAQSYGSTPASTTTDDANKALTTNEAVKTRVTNALRSDTSLSSKARSVQVTVEEGKVTLSGTVASDAEKAKIESMVRQQNGVKTVVNRLDVAK